uniref:Uncharacterized protein n=1 Tax=Marmota marmota marmota TaxID=9994 RepID=A0A8C6A1S8_MARMA
MKPGRSASPMREITTVEPGSKSVSMSDWEPEPHQKPITQPEPSANSGLKPQHESNTQQEFASQQRRLTQQEPLAPNEAEFQQETRAQQKSALHLKFLTLQKSPSTPLQKSPSTQKVYAKQQEAASQQGHGPGQACTTQQEPELRDRDVAQSGSRPSLAQQDAELTPTTQAIPGLKKRPSVQAEFTSQERTEQSDHTAQQVPPTQQTKSRKGFLTEWKFLTRLYEVTTQQVTQEQKTFFERLTDYDLESNGRPSSETDPPSMRDGTSTPEMKPAFKKIPDYDYEAMSGYHGTPLHGKKTSAQNHRHYQDTGESNLDLESLKVSHPFI